MKRILVASFFLLSSVCALPAQAETVAAPASLVVGYGLGEVNPSTQGTLTYSGINGNIWAEYYGSLPTMTKITFTYDITPVASTLPVSGYMGLSSIGASIVDASTNATAFTGVSPTPSQGTDKLVTAYASLPTFASGTASITNLSANLISFKSTLIAFLNQFVGLKVSYKVEAVPLPAALPLFGLGIASLVGYRVRKKKADAAA